MPFASSCRRCYRCGSATFQDIYKDRLQVVTLPVPINLLSRRGLIGNECCDTRSLICLLPAALFWYWQPVAVAQSIYGSLRRPALQYACTRHNWKRTPSVTNRSPPERRGMRFHVVFCSSLSVSCVMCRRIEDNHKLRVTQ